MNRVFLFILSCTVAVCPAAERAVHPVFSFGLVSDIQYADANTSGKRQYRDSVSKLNQCTGAWNRMDLSFVIQLGDFVDRGGVENLDRIASVYNRARAPKYHVLGNHDFFTGRSDVIKRLRMPAAYYEFSRPGWRFVVLDGMQVSAEGGWSGADPHGVLGRDLLSALTKMGAVNAKPWDGAAGIEQRAWLKKVLADAGSRHEHVIAFCHMPVLPESCRPIHLLWDHLEVVDLIDKSPAAVAFFNGHDHDGGFGEKDGIPYVTFPALVEHPALEACKVVDVYPDHLTIKSLSGREQVLPLRRSE
jgi:manganese-dependent ADP-ribose/CDP-alcohol diphosphatase